MADQFALVDTDVFIDLIRGKRRAARWAPLVEGSALVLSFVSVAELWAGAYRLSYGDDSRKNLAAAISATVVIPPTDALAHEWARLTTECRTRGHALGAPSQAHDAWIAATSRYYELPLLTGNARHFLECPGLTLVAHDS